MPETDPSGDNKAKRPPSLVPGVVLLAVAAVLIVVLIINPEMSAGLRKTIAGISIGVVVALLGYAGFVFATATKRGRK